MNKRSALAGSAVTASEKAKTFLAEFFNAAALPADAVSHHRLGKRGARIEQKREDQTHVSKHQSRERDGRVGTAAPFMLALWHEPGWAKGDEEGEIFCLRETEGGREEIGCSEKEKETQEDSKGCSEVSHSCKV